jgi:hypothetical protein
LENLRRGSTSAEAVVKGDRELSEKLAYLERTLEALRFGVRAESTQGDLFLSFQKRGKKWVLIVNGNLLVNASLGARMQCVPLIPKLILASTEAVETELQKVLSCRKKLEAFLEVLQVPRREA